MAYDVRDDAGYHAALAHIASLRFHDTDVVYRRVRATGAHGVWEVWDGTHYIATFGPNGERLTFVKGHTFLGWCPVYRHTDDTLSIEYAGRLYRQGMDDDDLRAIVLDIWQPAAYADRTLLDRIRNGANVWSV